MRRVLTLCAAVTVVAAAWLSGCTPSPIRVGPPPDPTTTTVQSHEGQDLGTAADRETRTPTQPVESARPTKPPTITSPTLEESKAREPAAGSPEVRLPCDARRAVEVAREDLTRRSGLSPGEIAAVSVEAVDWPDTSLGCPQPDMMYAQIITPGYLIVLEAGGQAYKYHADECRFVVLCRAQGTPSVPLIPADPDEIDDGEPWMPVQ